MLVPEDDDKTVAGPDVRRDQLDQETGAEAGQHDGEALSVGTRLAEFEITGLIGIGGFGIVYLARDISLGRDVAIKEYMPSSLASRRSGNSVGARSEKYAETFAAGLRSFMNEARMLALFDHPSLVKVHRCWESNGTAYMVMPYYQGRTLKRVLLDMVDPPSQEWLRALLVPLMDALELLHARSCFHRDIAPDNILVLNDGTPVLLDFGAARLVIGDMARNLTVILKPGYAPIEQYSGDPHMPQGAWTDVYALAAVLYYAIAGSPPVESVSRLVNDQYVPLGKVRTGQYSLAFLRSIDRAMSVKAADRPQSMAEFRSMMALDDRPGARVGTTPDFDLAPAKAAIGQRGARRLLIACAMLLAAVATGVSLMWDRAPQQRIPVALSGPPPAASAKVGEPELAVQRATATTFPKPLPAPVAARPTQRKSTEESIRSTKAQGSELVQAQKKPAIEPHSTDAARGAEHKSSQPVEDATRAAPMAVGQLPVPVASYDGVYNGKFCNLVSNKAPLCWPIALRIRDGVVEGNWPSSTKKGATATVRGAVAADGSVQLALAAWASNGAAVQASVRGSVDDGAIAVSGQWDHITAVSGNWKRENAAEVASAAKNAPVINSSFDGAYPGRLCNLVPNNEPTCWPIALRIRGAGVEGSWPSGTRKGATATARGTVAGDGSVELTLAAWAPSGSAVEAILRGRINNQAITMSGRWSTGGGVTGDWKRGP